MYVIERQLIKPLSLGGLDLPKGATVDSLDREDGTYIVFVHTGWWKVSAEHFEEIK